MGFHQSRAQGLWWVDFGWTYRFINFHYLLSPVLSQIGIIFPSQEYPPHLQMSKIRLWLGLDSIKMSAQGRRSSTLNYWATALALCLPSIPHKIHTSSVHIILLLYFCSIQVTPQIISPPRLNLLGGHTRSPHPSALPVAVELATRLRVLLQ